MPTTIRLPLRAFNAEVIKDLQEKSPDIIENSILF